MDYLRKAVDLAEVSYDMGEFPAGAVLVAQDKVYESDCSVGLNHSECTVIDKAIAAEGWPLAEATMYTSMEPCLMCYAKMYWAGVKNVVYIIPKIATNTLYAYEDDLPMVEHTKNFHVPIRIRNDQQLLDEALGIYKAWELRFTAVK